MVLLKAHTQLLFRFKDLLIELLERITESGTFSMHDCPSQFEPGDFEIYEGIFRL